MDYNLLFSGIGGGLIILAATVYFQKRHSISDRIRKIKPDIEIGPPSPLNKKNGRDLIYFYINNLSTSPAIDVTLVPKKGAINFLINRKSRIQYNNPKFGRFDVELFLGNLSNFQGGIFEINYKDEDGNSYILEVHINRNLKFTRKTPVLKKRPKLFNWF